MFRKLKDTEVGTTVGSFEGWEVTGESVGIGVGCEEGCLVGFNDGLFEGKRVGLEVLGYNVGKCSTQQWWVKVFEMIS